MESPLLTLLNKRVEEGARASHESILRDVMLALADPLTDEELEIVTSLGVYGIYTHTQFIASAQTLRLIWSTKRIAEREARDAEISNETCFNDLTVKELFQMYDDALRQYTLTKLDKRRYELSNESSTHAGRQSNRWSHLNSAELAYRNRKNKIEKILLEKAVKPEALKSQRRLINDKVQWKRVVKHYGSFSARAVLGLE